VQAAVDGVTWMLPDIFVVPLLVPANEDIFPDPDAPRPILVLLFVHAKVVPPTVLLKVSTPVAAPLHTESEEGTVTTGVAFTVTLFTVALAAVQPVAGTV
jgi:hypothetical protein